MSSKAQKQDLKDMDVLCTFKSKWRAKIKNMGVLNASDHIQIKIMMSKLSQKPQS